jgi:hypothetical protein
MIIKIQEVMLKTNTTSNKRVSKVFNRYHGTLYLDNNKKIKTERLKKVEYLSWSCNVVPDVWRGKKRDSIPVYFLKN